LLILFTENNVLQFVLVEEHSNDYSLDLGLKNSLL